MKLAHFVAIQNRLWRVCGLVVEPRQGWLRRRVGRGDAGHVGLGGALLEMFENALDDVRLFDPADDFCARVTKASASVHTDPEYSLRQKQTPK